MRQKETICGYQVEIDPLATAEWYSTANEWGCSCGHCRNFLELAKAEKLPAFAMTLLKQFKLPPGKATYVCELYTDSEGVHYQVSYRIAGTILSNPVNEAENVRCCHEPYPYGAPNFPKQHFDLEFFMTLPWVLEESPNE